MIIPININCLPPLNERERFSKCFVKGVKTFLSPKLIANFLRFSVATFSHFNANTQAITRITMQWYFHPGTLTQSNLSSACKRGLSFPSASSASSFTLFILIGQISIAYPPAVITIFGELVSDFYFTRRASTLPKWDPLSGWKAKRDGIQGERCLDLPSNSGITAAVQGPSLDQIDSMNQEGA